MRLASEAIALLALMLTCVNAWSHPGHDHWHDAVTAIAADDNQTDDTDPWMYGLAAVGLGVVAGATLKSGKSWKRFGVIGCSFAAVAAICAGCLQRENPGMPDQERPQAKNDVKLLETLIGHFEADGVRARSDADYFYLESNAFPSHPMMVGITSWQQQVPLPQPYTGKNAWRIPLQPVVAQKPISARRALYRGAIAIAVNGVPIFNALNNRGEDAYLAGELDEYGGHCGRGDDYHYHIAPIHLEKIVGKGKPIAYALDGFPIYGYADADGNVPSNLDEFNGRFEADGNYRYYSTRKYPYINGGMRGVVTVRGDQIEPQPRDSPVRPAGEPLRGAKITAFRRNDREKSYVLKYELREATHSVRYTIGKEDAVTFVFTDANGKERTETYRRRPRP